MIQKEDINNLIKSNFLYVQKVGYKGYDPKVYDYMPFTARASFKLTFFNKVLRRLEIEVFRRKFPRLLLPYLKFNKINAKTTIPYGLGVFMQCYSQMYKMNKDENILNEAIKVADKAIEMLIKTEKGLGIPNPSNGKAFKYGDGMFDDNTIYLPGGSEVFFGFYDLYTVTNNRYYLEICKKIVDGFITEFKQKYISDNKVSLNYSNTNDNSHILNANALAMSCISIIYKETKDDLYKDISLKIYNYLADYLSYKYIPYAGVEDKKRNKSWFGCDTYHTGFTLRGMYETADIFGLDKQEIVKHIKVMMEIFLIDDKIIVYKGRGQRGLMQDAHALAEYIRIFATYYDYFSKIEQEKYTNIILQNVNEFLLPDNSSYYYTVNKKKKYFLYMPRWVQAPMMNALSILNNRLNNEKNH